MSDDDKPGGGPTEGADEQVLGTGAASGVGRDLLRSLPPHAVVAYRGEPTASERAILCWPMSDPEREAFGSGLEAISNRLRDMTPEDIEGLLDKLGRETEELDLTEVRAEDRSSQDLPEELPAAMHACPEENHADQPGEKSRMRFMPEFLARR